MIKTETKEEKLSRLRASAKQIVKRFFEGPENKEELMSRWLYAFFHGQSFLALVFEPEAALLFLALWLLRLPVFLFLECHWLFFQALL
jgi:hypothetical protein